MRPSEAYFRQPDSDNKGTLADLVAVESSLFCG